MHFNSRRIPAGDQTLTAAALQRTPNLTQNTQNVRRRRRGYFSLGRWQAVPAPRSGGVLEDWDPILKETASIFDKETYIYQWSSKLCEAVKTNVLSVISLPSLT